MRVGMHVWVQAEIQNKPAKPELDEKPPHAIISAWFPWAFFSDRTYSPEL
jgi:hypothetical protein